MAHAAFDTLSTAQRLEQEFDFTPKQAEGTAKLLHEHLVGTVATKDDIKALKGDITALKGDIKTLDKKIDTSVKALREEMATKADLNAAIAEVKSDLKWMKGIGAAILAVLVLPQLAQLLGIG